MNDVPALAPDLADAVAQAGVDPTLTGRERRGSCDWTVDHACWVAMLLSLEEQTFYGRTFEEALAWCLVWLMAPEIGIGPYIV